MMKTSGWVCNQRMIFLIDFVAESGEDQKEVFMINLVTGNDEDTDSFIQKCVTE